jgi:hypothetical protein
MFKIRLYSLLNNVCPILKTATMAKIATNRIPSFIKKEEIIEIGFANDICTLNINAITNKYFEVFIIINFNIITHN